jgi:hypothetical protein
MPVTVTGPVPDSVIRAQCFAFVTLLAAMMLETTLVLHLTARLSRAENRRNRL